MQLAINSSKSQFTECSGQFNHYLYELRRAIFGPIMEMCTIWMSQDLRANYFTEQM